MSKIGGKIREAQTGEYTKKVGLFTGEVIAINPTTKEYNTILGFDPKPDAAEMVYVGESKDGNPYIRLDFWVKDTKSEFKNKIVFFVEDRVRTNRDETKTQYINDVGVCSWAANEDDLMEWFSARDYREAKSGEEELYGFLRNWLGKIDFFDKEDPADLSLNWKKLIKGDVSELKEQISGDYVTPFISLATVVTKEINDEVKEFQTIYNKSFIPEYSMKHFVILDYNDPMVQATVEGKTNKERKMHERFVANIIGDYGCKDFYVLSALKDYDPSENVVASDSPMEEDSSAPTY
jgi:hypothetical protein